MYNEFNDKILFSYFLQKTYRKFVNSHGTHSLFPQTNDYLRSLAEDYPDIVQLYVGGSSYEGRDILGVKLSYKDGNPKIFIESGKLLIEMHT